MPTPKKSASAAKYREANREAGRRYSAEWYAKNREAKKKLSKDYYALLRLDPDRLKERALNLKKRRAAAKLTAPKAIE